MAFTVTDQLSASNASTASIAMSPTANIAAGSLIVVAVYERNIAGAGAAGTLADSAGNVYVKAATSSPNNATTGGTGSIWYVLQCKALTTANSITYTKQTSGVIGCIAAISATYSGLCSLLFNQTPTTGTSAGPSITGGAVSTTRTALGVAGIGIFANSTADTFTQSGGWSNGPDHKAQGTTTAGGVGGGNIIQTGTAAFAWNPTITSRDWCCFLLGFQEVPIPDGGRVLGFFGNPDDSSFWQGSPLRSQTLSLLTAQKFFGAGGQVPTKQWSPYLTNDDPPVWSPAADTLNANPNLFKPSAAQTPIKLRQPQFNNDDAPVWSPTPDTLNANPNLFTPPKPGNPRAPFWHPKAEHGPDVFQGPSAANPNLLKATQQYPFNRVPIWYSEDPAWSGEPVNSAPLQLLTQQKVYGQGGQVPPFRWNATLDDAAPWSGEPINSAPIQLLTAQRFYGQGGQGYPSRWNWGIDDPPVWSGEPINSAPLQLLTAQHFYGQGGQVPPARWNYHNDDAPSWQQQQARSNTISLLTVGGQVKQPRWNWGLDESAPWLQPKGFNQPLNAPVTTRYFTNPFASWYSSDASDTAAWQTTLFVNRNLAQVEFISNARVRWNYEDDPRPWQPEFVFNQILNTPVGKLFKPARWHYNDDASTWQWSATLNPNLFAPPVPGMPRGPFWHPKAEHGPDVFQGTSAANPNLLKSAGLYQIKGNFASWFSYGDDDPSPLTWWLPINLNPVPVEFISNARVRWNYEDDPPPWRQPNGFNQVLNTTFGNPFKIRIPGWYSEDAIWTGTPLRSDTLAMLSVGGQVKPFRWNWGLDDAPSWQLQPARSDTISLLTVGGQVKPFRWNWGFDDPSFWQGAPVGYVIDLPIPGRPKTNSWFSYWALQSYDIDAPGWVGSPLNAPNTVNPIPPPRTFVPMIMRLGRASHSIRR